MSRSLLKRFDAPDEVREFDLGRFEVIHVAGMTLGRATYQPGWKWSQHVAPLAGTPSCQVPHVGVVLRGRAMVRMDDGAELLLEPGTVFEIAPGHDSWVVGDEPYVSLHLVGAEAYAREPEST